jgi:hypothetical protein
MKAPQIIIIVLFGLQLGIALVEDGKTKTSKTSFIHTLISTGLTVWILIAGGFFG